MLFNLIFFTQAHALPNLSNKFKNVVSNAIPNQTKQEYNTHCNSTLEKIIELEGSIGPITKDNLASYEQARLNLNIALGSCANVDAADNVDVLALQKDAVDKIYSVFIAKHLIIDQFGQTGGFDPTSQNLFVATSPLVEEHYICQPETMGKVDDLIGKSWLTRELVALEETIRGNTPLIDFENTVAADHDNYVAIAEKKSEDCLANKLEEIRAYTDAADYVTIQEWEGIVRLEFSNHTDLEINRIVFPHSQFKRVTETTREYDNGTIREFHQDYDVMDTYVYVLNGKFVDAYLISLYKDYVKNEEYARFYGKDANGKLRVSQRLLLTNFQ